MVKRNHVDNFWKAAVSVAGIGAIVSYVFWSLYKGFISLPIFQTLTKQHLFYLLFLFLTLTCAFAIVGLIAYIVLALADKNRSKASVSELIEVLRRREQSILAKVEERRAKYDKLRNEHRSACLPGENALFDSFSSKFLKLSSANLQALNDGKFVASHELTREISKLLGSGDAEKIFCRHIVFDVSPEEPEAERWKPVYSTAELPGFVYFKPIVIEDIPGSLLPTLEYFNRRLPG